MAGTSMLDPADTGRAMAAGISEHPAAFLTRVDREAHDWLVRFAAGNAGPADLEAFKAWSAQAGYAEAFARACRLWAAVEPASKRMAVAQVPAQRPRIGRRAFVGGALAASLSAAIYAGARPPLGLWPSLSELAADYRTAPGEQRKFVLAGGPSIELNTRTSVAVRGSADDGIERIELIGGEAAIATRSDVRSAIEVIAGDCRVTATTAAFNIRYESDVVCATCVAGEIVVAFGGRSANLRRGEQVVYASGNLGVVAKIDAAAVTAWKDGMLVFRLTPLADAIAEINRYRRGRIIVTSAALGRRLFNARFPIANVDGVVAQIQQIFGASVTALPGGIVLLG
ncbi:FecR domain-containing protein [Bradyrhizobium sp. WSM 1738]|uniref:FecR family protein n=1 Tax=Bradyrhizobium hereditatis TaxID=2821405 RepID=UPI001CE38C9A|nr:FecR domain-containing protein [Bradyrhizobium hereditatis]MCA6116449.1 FecR domain-containing protein [Bradyrhizobium hereditatis]